MNVLKKKKINILTIEIDQRILEKLVKRLPRIKSVKREMRSLGHCKFKEIRYTCLFWDQTKYPDISKRFSFE